MLRSYDHLQAGIYLLELTLLTTDPLHTLKNPLTFNNVVLSTNMFYIRGLNSVSFFKCTSGKLHVEDKWVLLLEGKVICNKQQFRVPQGRNTFQGQKKQISPPTTLCCPLAVYDHVHISFDGASLQHQG
jgi:hypothetical protein